MQGQEFESLEDYTTSLAAASLVTNNNNAN